jgi:hypothetical protein
MRNFRRLWKRRLDNQSRPAAARHGANMLTRIAAAIVFLAGALIVAAPLVFRLGWLAAAAGIVLGVAVGVSAGVLWATARPADGITLDADERWS